MSRHAHPWSLARAAFFACMLACACAAAAPGWGASTSVTVSMDVTSATSLNATACATGTSAVTSFGVVQPGTSFTSNDCVVGFGSSNDTSSLRLWQTDNLGAAMYGPSRGAYDTNWKGPAGTGSGSFTITGAVTTNVNYTRPHVRWQPTTGKVVMAFLRSGIDQTEVVRFNADGSLDPTFGTAGRTLVGAGWSWHTGGAMEIGDDGSIYVGGVVGGGGGFWQVAKLTPNGVLDVNFDGATNGNGVVQWDSQGPIDSKVYDLELTNDGGIALAGFVENGSGQEASIQKLTATGHLDSTFSGDGRAKDQLPGGNTMYQGIVEQPDGKLVVAGGEWIGNRDLVFARYNANGTLDTGFTGPGGTASGLFNIPDAIEGFGHAVARLPDGDILAVGWSNANGEDIWTVRIDGTTGALDPAWKGPSGTGAGKVRYTLGGGSDVAYGVYVSDIGEIFITGRTAGDVFVMKLRDDGSLDPDFDGPSGSGNGIATYAPSAGVDEATSVAPGPDGDLLVAGINGSSALAWSARLVGAAYPDYADGSQDWDQGQGFFGVCLSSLTGTGATPAWTATAGCPQSDAAGRWRSVPVAGNPSKVGSLTSGALNGLATLKFAVRVPLAQPPGAYRAPLTFEVLAPG